jgi:sporulation protein YlmC with PRC-barrel domain
MRVDLGAEVRTTDGQVVGKIKHLIMNPETTNVRSVVIEKGFLLTDDVEVPLDRLHYGVDNRIELECTKEEYDHLPRFDRSRYTDRPPANVVLAGFPPVGVLWNSPVPFPMDQTGVGAYPAAATAEETWDAAAEGGAPTRMAETGEPAGDTLTQGATPAVIERGSTVYSSDDQRIGEVREVTFDVSTGRPLVLVIRSGLILHHDTQVPADLIQEVNNGEVRLNVTADKFKSDYATPIRPAA